MKRYVLISLTVILSLVVILSCKNRSSAVTIDESLPEKIDRVRGDIDMTKYKEITLAGGCFWGVQKYFSEIHGVQLTDVGYANSKVDTPSYEDVSAGHTDAAEAVRVIYDPKTVSLPFILDMYAKVIDPTSYNRQGNDRGSQYRTGIYYTDKNDKPIIDQFISKLQKSYDKKIMIEVTPITNYYLAENYHQNYLDKNPNGYCHIGKDKFNEAKKAKDSTLMPTDKIEKLDFKKPDQKVIKDKLTDMQYKVTQEEGTEPAFKNEYWDNFEAGIYVDIVTGEPLFSSKDKFKSSSGWPSFTKPIDKSLIKEHTDKSHGMFRTEVKSTTGDTHLGHVFADGPADKGGLRYCMNSASLKFIPKSEMQELGYGYLLGIVQ